MKKSNIKALTIIIGVLLAYFLPVRYINFLGNDRVIDFGNSEYSKNKGYYLELIKYIDNLKINQNFVAIYYYSRRSKISFFDLDKNNFLYIDNTNTAKIMYIIARLKCEIIIKKHEYIAFTYKKSNFTGSSDIKLVYDLKNARPTKKQYPGFEILEKEQRPSSFSKWIYIIDDYWYILIE